ncbi:MAG: cysteine--tRNA ligase [Coprobacillus sp.]|nr:cysteine--tRNA ligase [Coprobacillus sp.]
MDLKLYNSKTGKVETFTPLKEGKVSMYVCGPTVYNHPHIGNMRPVVVFDVLRSLLSHLGYEVTYVSNYTDVDDKIIQECQKEGLSEKELTDYYIGEFNSAALALGSKLPTLTPRVTEYMDQIIGYIYSLVYKGYAYEVNGSVYFDVTKIIGYGMVSHVNSEELKAGSRVEVSDDKKSPLDFALWKKTDVGIRWKSPWGEGRPGWHTECAVMINSIFNEEMIDIHGGGYDLKFPHHENENAQCLANTGHELAHFWVHNSFINIDNEKMSKSLGNVLLAKDLIEMYGGDVIRLVILSTHYRQTVNFTEGVIESAKIEINKLKASIKSARLLLALNHAESSDLDEADLNTFMEALCDDLNTSNAIMEVDNEVKKLNALLRVKDKDIEAINKAYLTLNEMLDILGLHPSLKELTDESLGIYKNYLKAREEGNYSLSDELRADLINRDVL